MIKSITKLATVGLLALSLAACTTGGSRGDTGAPNATPTSSQSIAVGEPNGSTAPTTGTNGGNTTTAPSNNNTKGQPTVAPYQQQKAVDPKSAKGQNFIKRIKTDAPRLATASKNDTGLVRNGANLCSYISLIQNTQKRTPSAAEEADFVVRFYDGGQDKVSKAEAQAVVKATLDTICPEYK